MDHNYSAGRSFIVTQSAEKLTEAPAVPQSVNIEQAEQGKVKVTWMPADGAPLSTTYEMYILTEDGRLLGNCRAFIDEAHQGQRKVEEAGNRGTATSALLSLSDGTYTIGVQAVDGRRQGSPFCTCQFRMTDGIPTAIRSISRQDADIHYYNLSGQPVQSPAPGSRQIVVSKGKKSIY